MNSSSLQQELHKRKPQVPITNELLTKFQQEANVLPLFEKQIYDYVRMKHVSLAMNESLECRWREYSQLKNRKATHMSVHSEAYRFKNQMIRYDPEETVRKRKNNRKHLTVGPGYDLYGEIPIPDDVHVRRTVGSRHYKPTDVKNVK